MVIQVTLFMPRPREHIRMRSKTCVNKGSRHAQTRTDESVNETRADCPLREGYQTSCVRVLILLMVLRFDGVVLPHLSDQRVLYGLSGAI
jgi:hypothetical protein